MIRVISAAAAAILFGAMALGVQAQTPPQAPPDPGPPAATPDTVQLIFEREVFAYPSHVRRNPFRALSGVGEGGPRYEDLSLLGVILSSEPGGSVALMGVRGAQTAQTAMNSTQRLRVGQRLGNVRIVEIREREVVVQVEEFGMLERRVMALARTAPEAQSAGAGPGSPAPAPADTPPPAEPGGGDPDAGDPDEEPTGGPTGRDMDLHDKGGL